MVDPSIAYFAATLAELEAGVRGRRPVTTRQQSAMIGRYYWYSSNKARKLGFKPATAQSSLVSTISWLVKSPHISRETRAGLNLSPEIFEHRAKTDYRDWGAK